MAHKAQITYCNQIKQLYPEYFIGKNVLDVGSMDINGNNRYLFTDCNYTGIDLGEGNNVDIVSSGHEFRLGEEEVYDFIISTEMLEHNKYWKETLQNMVKLLKKDGMILVTCAGEGRAEHGTTRTSPEDAPYTNDYYQNFNETMLREAIDMEKTFWDYEISNEELDFRFFGLKNRKQ